MKKHILLMVASLLAILLCVAPAHAGTIEKGTFALGGGSNMFFFNRDSDFDNNPEYDGDYNLFSFSVDSSYFVINNLEIGLQWDYYRRNDNKNQNGIKYDYSEFTIGPIVGYHLPLNSSSNLFIRAGLGIGKAEYHVETSGYIDQKIDIKSFFGSAGWEYFLNSNIAFNLGLKYSNLQIDPDRGTDETISKLGGDLRLKLYF